MSGIEDTTYRAFLSYSHKDAGIAAWFHKKLEGWRIDADLVGRETSVGPVPETLRPIFRDRDDFAGGYSLVDASISALRASQFLIVLCSPNSAKSKYVNEEVRLFKSMGRSNRVIPVIIEGEADGNEEEECFPPAVRFTVSNTGQLTTTPAEPIAADARDVGDGRERAAAKVVAGLLGVRFDDIIQRARRSQRRRRLQAAFGGAAFVLVASAGGFYYWQSQQLAIQHQQSQSENARLQKLVDRLLVSTSNAPERLLPGTRTVSTPSGQRETLTTALRYAQSQADEGDERMAEALSLLEEGKREQAEELFRQVAQDKAGQIDKNKSDAAAAYRSLGAISRFSDQRRARQAYERSLEFEPDNPDALYWFGFLQMNAGYLQSAKTSFEGLLARPDSELEGKDRFRGHVGLAEVLVKFGNKYQAERHARLALDTAQARLDATPGNSERLLELAIAQRVVSELYLASDNGAQHMDWLTKAHDTFQSVLNSDPGNILAWSEVALAKAGLALAHGASGNISEARTHITDAQNFVQNTPDQRSTANPSGAVAEVRSMVSLAAGRILLMNYEHQAALDAIERAREVIRPLAEADPTNVNYPIVVAATHMLTAQAMMELDTGHSGAAEHMRTALALLDKAMKDNPASQYAAPVSTSACIYSANLGGGTGTPDPDALIACLDVADKLFEADSFALEFEGFIASVGGAGQTLLKAKRLTEALAYFDLGVHIARHWVDIQPDNSLAQWVLAILHGRRGMALQSQGDLVESLKARGEQIRVLEAIPADARDTREVLAQVHTIVAGVHHALGDDSAAARSYRASLTFWRKLADSNPDNEEWQKRIAYGHSWFGRRHAEDRELQLARSEFEQGRAIIERMLRRSPENEVLKQDLARFDQWIKSVSDE